MQYVSLIPLVGIPEIDDLSVGKSTACFLQYPRFTETQVHIETGRPDLPILGPFDRKILTFTVPLGSNNVIL